MGWMHGCFAGVIIEGGTRESAGVILLSRGTGWAKASAQASNVAKSANCLCNLFICQQSQQAAPSRPFTLPIDARCKNLRIVTFGPALVNFAVNSRLRKWNKSRPFPAGQKTRRLFRFRGLVRHFLQLKTRGALKRNDIYNWQPCVRIGHGRKSPAFIISRCSIFLCKRKKYTAGFTRPMKCRCAGCSPSRLVDVRRIALTVRKARATQPGWSASR